MARNAYEVRIGGVPVCRGSAAWCARALGIMPSTVMQYQYEGRGPSYIEVECIPPRYRLVGDDCMEGTARELSERVGVNQSRFYYAHTHGQRVGGYRVEKLPVMKFALPSDMIEGAICGCRRTARSGA